MTLAGWRKLESQTQDESRFSNYSRFEDGKKSLYITVLAGNLQDITVKVVRSELLAFPSVTIMYI